MLRFTKYFIFALFCIFIAEGSYQFNFGSERNNINAVILTPTFDSKQLNANYISAWFKNNGSFNRDPSTGNAGFVWPIGTGRTARYCSGVWLGAKVGNDTLVAAAEYSYDYQPGYIDVNGIFQGANDSNYHMYSITQGDTLSPDYLNWPGINNQSNNQGAYVDSAHSRPVFLGAKTFFYTMTDGSRGWSGTNVPPMKVQILQTCWAYNVNGLKDAIFIEMRIINKNTQNWNDTYIGIWTDDDLGSGTDDHIGCDTSRNMMFTFNGTNNDGIYGSAPPAVAFKFLRGPYVYTGNPNNIVYYFKPGYRQRYIKTGYRELRMCMHNTYNGSSPQPSDPQNEKELYNIVSGKWRTGQSWINPQTGQPTKFVYPGDPVSQTGWYDNRTPTDVRNVFSVGPLNIASNDTQTVTIVQFISRGSSNLGSVTSLRQSADYIQNLWDNNIFSVDVKNTSSIIPRQFKLEQNYPNPFNPTTKIRFDVGVDSRLRGNDRVVLRVFDILGKEIATLVNEKQAPGVYEVTFDGTKYPSGVYFYKLNSGDFQETKRMILLK